MIVFCVTVGILLGIGICFGYGVYLNVQSRLEEAIKHLENISDEELKAYLKHKLNF